MGTKSKFFRAFVEGQTISDGRVITKQMIDEIVSTFNAETYSPRINIEHIAGYSPEPPFNGYGDICAVKAQDDDIVIDGKTVKRRALYCQADGNDQLVALAERDQKPYPSVELTPDYAGCGKIGLLGLAFTDNPASIGTQRLQFSRVNGNILFTASDRVTMEFEAKPEPDAATKAFAAMTGFFTKLTGGTPAPATPTTPAAPTPPAGGTGATTPAPANDNFAQLQEGLGLMAASITALGTKIDTDVGAIRAEFGTLKTQLAATPDPTTFSRTPSTGGGKGVLTDC